MLTIIMVCEVIVTILNLLMLLCSGRDNHGKLNEDGQPSRIVLAKNRQLKYKSLSAEEHAELFSEFELNHGRRYHSENEEQRRLRIYFCLISKRSMIAMKRSDLLVDRLSMK